MLSVRRGFSRLIFPHLLGAHPNSLHIRTAQLTEPIAQIVAPKFTFLGPNYQISFFNTDTLCSSDPNAPTTLPANLGGSNVDPGVISGGGVNDDEDDDSRDSDDDDDVRSEDEFDAKPSDSGPVNEKLNHDVEVILDILRSISCNHPKDEGSGCSTVISGSQVKKKLDECGVIATSELVWETLGRLRNDWEASFTFFLWAGKQPGYAHSTTEYDKMISILAKQRKFDTAWALISEMRKGKNGEESVVNYKSLLIMIRRYAAAHDVGNAINTFHAFKRFNLPIGMEEFQKLLAALCRYKNVKDAELLLFSNKITYPFNTKSFNIILNGWCNVVGSPREGKRFWRVMIEHGIKLDSYSYSSMISSYSKSNRLKEVLRLFDQMKNRGIVPDKKVYNAVIHALAKNGHLKEAFNLLRVMEEKGIAPNIVTYNSLIKPLCRARKKDEAKMVFDEIFCRQLQPTIRTYHAFLRIQPTGAAVFTLLDKMKETGCHPNKDTYMMLIRKFCRWRQLDIVFKLWDQMRDQGLNDDRSSYIVLIHGLFLNGKLKEAHEIYVQMKERSLPPDPTTDELIQTWLSNKEMAESKPCPECGSMDHSQATGTPRLRTSKFDLRRAFLRQPESRKVVKDRGFSFWE